MKDCSKCKLFIYCDWGKILFYKACTDEDCKEYEERKVKNEEKESSGVS